ncbi:hypothetical protein BSKO_00287 [Bryopsis sp. KO-2023]|nr:hypothetical protein BSKO_00287 [Bryopsis sp. KO-2023]
MRFVVTTSQPKCLYGRHVGVRGVKRGFLRNGLVKGRGAFSGPLRTSFQPFPRPSQESVHVETDPEERSPRFPQVTIPIEPKTDTRTVGRVLAEVFRVKGNGSVLCKESKTLRKTLMVLAVAINTIDDKLWVSFKEEGQLIKAPDGSSFRGLRFTLEEGKDDRIWNEGSHVFQVTANTKSLNLSSAMEGVLFEHKRVGLRSVGYQALSRSVNAAKRLRRKLTGLGHVMLIRPGFDFLEGDKKRAVRLQIDCGVIPKPPRTMQY